MATSVSKTHLFRTLNKRRFASAAAQHATGYYSNDVEIENLSNKLTVASVDSSLPLSRFSVIIKAGSRYDPTDVPGLNHVLRSSAGLTTSNSTTFGITRNVQQIGANIQVTGNRDTITYTLEATCDQLNKGLRFLKDIVVNQVFKPWELEDNVPRIKYELAILPPQAKLVDLLHKAAYRTGLGNTLFVKDYNIGRIGSETLQHHVSSLFTSQRTAVVGVGVGHDTVVNFASDLELPVGVGPEVPPTYHGGEVSEEAPTSFTHVGLAVKAAGLKDKDLLAFAVLRYLLGGWSTIKWTPGNSPLTKAVKKVDESANVSAFNSVHADTGLFGILVTASSSKAKSALFTAAEVLNQNVTADAVTRAKNQLKTDVLHAIQNGEELAADIASQVLLKGCYTDSCSLSDAIDKVSESDVSNALKKFKTSKKALATYGNLSEVPYLDEFN